MRKIAKRWGDSIVIVLDKEDLQINNISEGDVIDVEIKGVEKKKVEDEEGN